MPIENWLQEDVRTIVCYDSHENYILGHRHRTEEELETRDVIDPGHACGACLRCQYYTVGQATQN